MKILLSLFIVLSLCSVVYSDNSNSDDEETLMLIKLIKETQEKQRVLDLEEEKLNKRQEEAKAKTEAVMKLGRTVDKLAKTLGVDE